MLKKVLRLKTKELEQVIKTGKAYHSTFFMIRVLSGVNQKTPKFAVIASKKVAKTAVQRNQIRRKVFQALEKFVLTIKPDYRIIIFVKDANKKIIAKDLEEDLAIIFKKAKITV